MSPNSPDPSEKGAPSFQDTRFWIFDLDNTLYSSDHAILDRLDERSTLFLQNLLAVDVGVAAEIRRSYQRSYGTTLRGLMTHYDVNPEEFLDFVHQVDLSDLKPAPDLAATIGRLPGRRIIHTNAPGRHAKDVIASLGIGHVIDDILDISGANYRPKPDRRSYARLIERFDVDPICACMFEDRDQNLQRPAELGMRTVLVIDPGTSGQARVHAQHVTSDLCGFLTAVAGLDV
jgi:putative hydrolase of the HAD superfamily